MIETPSIATEALPESEREAAVAVRSNLSGLQTCVDQLEAALDLFDFARGEDERVPPPPDELKRLRDQFNRGGPGMLEASIVFDRRREAKIRFARWAQIAAKSGAMSIFEFYELAEGIEKLLEKNCPTLSAMVDRDDRERARKAFKRAFPNMRAVRAFAAHGNAMTRFPEKARKHRSGDLAGLDPLVKAPEGTQIIIGGAVSGREFVATHDKKTVKYSLSQETVAALRKILAIWYDIFKQAERVTKEIAREQQLKNLRRPREDQNRRQS